MVSPDQIERLYTRFTSLDRGDCGTLSRDDFLRIPELAINPLGERIVHAFFYESGRDRINFPQFMQVLACLRPIKQMTDNHLNSREQKLRFAFKTYDIDSDDFISRDELLAVLQMMVGAIGSIFQSKTTLTLFLNDTEVEIEESKITLKRSGRQQTLVLISHARINHHIWLGSIDFYVEDNSEMVTNHLEK
ncbi:unnamed protein product [Nezara viridula]|uniref:EF-hand domain-containing protein n=1 Tax=Nezara viridula TaxID=85310 RepID=A0A9P0MT20_NEZVI|nr:unnamed protein product [Nezara viridula]